MNELEIQKIENIKKGAFVKICYRSFPTILKANTTNKGIVVEKVTNMVGRIGINFANMQANKDRVVGSLAWGQWEDGKVNYIIEYNGKKYLRIYTSTIKPIVKYFLNGVETTKEYLISNGIISNKKSEHTECFNVKLENIISIG